MYEIEKNFFFLESENTKSQTPELYRDSLEKERHDSGDRPSTSSAAASGPPNPRPDDPALNALLRKYSKIINRGHQEGTIQKEYNFALDNLQLSYEDLQEQLRTIFQNEHQVFKINFSMGIVLRNTEGELRYFYASGNETALLEPFQISKLGDVDSLILRLRTLDILQTALQSRPDSKWSVYVVTNIRWVVTRTNYVLGAGRKLPDYI